jgi:hypothetical protein
MKTSKSTCGPGPPQLPFPDTGAFEGDRTDYVGSLFLAATTHAEPSGTPGTDLCPLLHVFDNQAEADIHDNSPSFSFGIEFLGGHLKTGHRLWEYPERGCRPRSPQGRFSGIRRPLASLVRAMWWVTSKMNGALGLPGAAHYTWRSGSRPLDRAWR